MPRSTAATAALLGGLLSGCALEEGGPERAAPAVERVFPWAPAALPAAVDPPGNPSSPAKVELGRLLFYDPILSTDRAVACATCHSEVWGMADGLARSVGVDGAGPTGPGRDGPNVTRRNAQTLWNAGLRERMFWDGRAASLEEQVLGPLHEPRELGREPALVVADLGAIPAYGPLFSAAFPGEAPAVSVLHLQQAIAAFERSLVSNRAPYDQFIAGDEGALSAAAQRGMWLFGEVGCAGCHVPPRFEAEIYADRRVAPVPFVRDEGRKAVTGADADRYAFRVPTLRNVRETGPYFHSGAVETLADAVQHEADLAAETRPLSAAEVADLVTFLDKGLIDPSRSPGRPAEVPSGLPVPVDGFRIPR